MRNRRKWYSLLLAGLVLILATSVMACAPSATPTAPARTPAPTQQAPAPTPTTSAILWSEAKNHIGERTMVYGPVIAGNEFHKMHLSRGLNLFCIYCNQPE